MKLKLDMSCHLLNAYTKFQIDISKHVEKKSGKLGRTDGRTDGQTDGHCHSITRPVLDGLVFGRAWWCCYIGRTYPSGFVVTILSGLSEQEVSIPSPYLDVLFTQTREHCGNNSSLKRRIWCSKREPFHMLLPWFRRVVPLVALLRPQRVIRCLGSLRSGCLNAVNAILPQFNVLTINLRQNPHMETCHINLGNLRGKWYSLREKYCINRMYRVKGE